MMIRRILMLRKLTVIVVLVDTIVWIVWGCLGLTSCKKISPEKFEISIVTKKRIYYVYRLWLGFDSGMDIWVGVHVLCG
jgi:hypothetical protein